MKLTISNTVKIGTIAALLLTGGLATSASALVSDSKASVSAAAPAKPKPAKNQYIVINMKKLASKAKEAQQLIHYMNKHIYKVTPAQADEMFIILETYYEKHVEQATARLNARMQDPKVYAEIEKLGNNLNQFNKIKDKSLKKWLLTQQNGKLRLGKDLATYYFYVDYPALQTAYHDKFTEDTELYLQHRSIFTEYYYNDNPNKLSLQDLGKLIHTIDVYTKTTTNRHKEKFLEMHASYLWNFLHGSRAEYFDEKTGKLLPKIQESYSLFLAKYRGTRSSSILFHYVKLLEKNDGIAFDSKGSPLPYYQKFWDEEYDALYKKTFK